MNVLIVDDESFSVLAIRKKVDWENLCEEEICLYDAYSAQQAREVMGEHPIDIMLCDIEMAGETGIELIRWVRGQQLPMEILIITCHEDFHYVKEALRLGVYDYCVKPLDFTALEGLLRELVRMRDAKQRQRERNQYADYWLEEKEGLTKQFWYWFLTEKDQDPDRVWERTRRLGISVSEEEAFFPIVIAIRKYEISLVKWDPEKMERSLRSLIREVMKETDCEVILGVKGAVVVILRDGGQDAKKGRELVEQAYQLFQIRVCCWLGGKTPFLKLPGRIDALIRRLESDVSHQEGVFSEEDWRMKHELHGLPDRELPPDLLAKLETCRFSEFRLQLHVWLKDRERSGRFSREELIYIRECLRQAYYLHFEKLHVSAAKLGEDEKMKVAYEDAGRLVAGLEEWADLVTKYLEARYEEQLGTEIHVRIQKVKEYIDENLDRELTRQELAQIVFLNQDYFARVFKEKEHVSIMEYLTRRRIEEAVKLMLHTELSMSEIAGRCGFVSVSYFSTVFKKIMGVSPREFKKQR